MLVREQAADNTQKSNKRGKKSCGRRKERNHVSENMSGKKKILYHAFIKGKLSKCIMKAHRHLKNLRDFVHGHKKNYCCLD